MKTIGLFMILQVFCIILFSLTLTGVSQGEKIIIGLIEAWCMYKLMKEDLKG